MHPLRTHQYSAQSQSSNKIVPNPFNKKGFSYGEYVNWFKTSPTFTYKDYQNYNSRISYSIGISQSGMQFCMWQQNQVLSSRPSAK